MRWTHWGEVGLKREQCKTVKVWLTDIPITETEICGLLPGILSVIYWEEEWAKLLQEYWPASLMVKGVTVRVKMNGDLKINR